MRDYTFITESNSIIPVSQMSTEEIYSCLASPNTVQAIPSPKDGNETIEDFLERLRIELVIRTLPQPL